MTNKCIISQKPIKNLTDAISHNNKWISWVSINQHIHKRRLREIYPKADIELIKIFEELLHTAVGYRAVTGRHLPVFGELGEIFIEIILGLKRHGPMTPGSDGRLGDNFIEIKTMSPMKKQDKVLVKRKGNFNILMAVKVSEDFDFEARMLRRKDMAKGTGTGMAQISWSQMNPIKTKAAKPKTKPTTTRKQNN